MRKGMIHYRGFFWLAAILTMGALGLYLFGAETAFRIVFLSGLIFFSLGCAKTAGRNADLHTDK